MAFFKSKSLIADFGLWGRTKVAALAHLPALFLVFQQSFQPYYLVAVLRGL